MNFRWCASNILDTSVLVYCGRRGPSWPGLRPIRYGMVAWFHHMVSHGQDTTCRSPSPFRSNTWPLSSSWNPSVHLARIETILEWHEYFSQFQDTTDTLPCHIHLPVCLWMIDPYSRAPKKNTGHGNKVLPQDTTHLIQKPFYQRGSPCQDPTGDRSTRNPLNIVKRRKLQWYGHVSRSSGLSKIILQGTVKRGRRQGRHRKRWEDNIGNWQAWSSPSPWGQWRTGKNGWNWLWNLLWCPNNPRG